jgi:hypothetical protein
MSEETITILEDPCDCENCEAEMGEINLIMKVYNKKKSGQRSRGPYRKSNTQ